MENLLNMVMPVIVGVGFVGFILYQIFGGTDNVKRERKQNILYYADSTNSGTLAKDVFNSIDDLNPDYLGMRDKEL